STNQIMARLKLAEVQFQLKQYTNAIQSYRLIVEQADKLPDLPRSWLERTLYQLVQACIEVGEVAGAREGLERLFVVNPRTEFGDRALMLMGQMLGNLGKLADARAHFARLITQFPQSTLVPEAQSAT